MKLKTRVVWNLDSKRIRHEERAQRCHPPCDSCSYLGITLDLFLDYLSSVNAQCLKLHTSTRVHRHLLENWPIGYRLHCAEMRVFAKRKKHMMLKVYHAVATGEATGLWRCGGRASEGKGRRMWDRLRTAVRLRFVWGFGILIRRKLSCWKAESMTQSFYLPGECLLLQA